MPAFIYPHVGGSIGTRWGRAFTSSGSPPLPADEEID